MMTPLNFCAAPSLTVISAGREKVSDDFPAAMYDANSRMDSSSDTVQLLSAFTRIEMLRRACSLHHSSEGSELCDLIFLTALWTKIANPRYPPKQDLKVLSSIDFSKESNNSTTRVSVV
mmetsp:Transcript_28608/g.45063  ORF Transcript_28608/g.45063 Transcript_28608/m.45063 type:complete len:119 (+) Transcript_28608:135-491(+)